MESIIKYYQINPNNKEVNKELLLGLPNDLIGEIGSYLTEYDMLKKIRSKKLMYYIYNEEIKKETAFATLIDRSYKNETGNVVLGYEKKILIDKIIMTDKKGKITTKNNHLFCEGLYYGFSPHLNQSFSLRKTEEGRRSNFCLRDLETIYIEIKKDDKLLSMKYNPRIYYSIYDTINNILRDVNHMIKYYYEKEFCRLNIDSKNTSGGVKWLEYYSNVWSSHKMDELIMRMWVGDMGVRCVNGGNKYYI
jgi:hypothetical protein